MVTVLTVSLTFGTRIQAHVLLLVGLCNLSNGLFDPTYTHARAGKVASVLAMEVSAVDGGAVLSPFSQYPTEEETCYNACSYLQNLQGDLLVLRARSEIRMARDRNRIDVAAYVSVLISLAHGVSNI